MDELVEIVDQSPYYVSKYLVKFLNCWNSTILGRVKEHVVHLDALQPWLWKAAAYITFAWSLAPLLIYQSNSNLSWFNATTMGRACSGNEWAGMAFSGIRLVFVTIGFEKNVAAKDRSHYDKTAKCCGPLLLQDDARKHKTSQTKDCFSSLNSDASLRFNVNLACP